MHKSSLLAALVLGAAFAAAPAFAKTSVAKSAQLCEAAAKAQTPAPKNVRADKDRIRSSDAAVTVPLKVRNPDDSAATLTCTVDRETGTPTLAPAP